ncbi:bidirectional sugar transporter SWEET10-like [Hevea brasiliensis]|uniref:bidirectional sugar transporter SWEET10-like n=1 Tax=Hevea brasiliensis TaxID=3981 RepID=UPI000B77AC46|nr:bidirectional sugar transporter SWEET10-like [Hevea brasiliensis]
MALHLTWGFAFGLLGNILSILVCFAPIPTFYQICKKKTSEGFQSFPYVIALLSAMLWLFYAYFAEDATLLISVNSITFCMETAYLSLYFFYASKKDKIITMKSVLLFNVFGFGIISIIAMFLTHGKERVKLLGWICMIFALSVFVAPLGIVRKVIQTKSVEFMPFSLSLFLTLSAVMWFFYGFLRRDFFVAIPNTLGFIFGAFQMLLYVIYRKPRKSLEKPTLDESPEHVIDVPKPDETICCELNTGHEVVEDKLVEEQPKQINQDKDLSDTV